MPYTTPDDAGDLAKLQQAFSEIWATFGSVDNLLEAFGLSDLPVAQRYGIVIGCIVFVGTVTAVLSLLVLGGSFRRIAEQATTGSTTIPADYRARLDRPLLLEHLLDARERLLRQNYPKQVAARKLGRTNLTNMLLTVRPPPKGTSEKQDKTGYMKNYVVAYRKCQDKPGGTYQWLRSVRMPIGRAALFCEAHNCKTPMFRWNATRTTRGAFRGLFESLCWMW